MSRAPALVPEGSVLRQKPTLLLLHGGPGFDHSLYKPADTALADVAPIICLDHRGNGRSDWGAKDAWTLAQWGDDVVGFCAALGIERPIVLGTSFGGKVAMAYATRHPAHPAKLILISTEAAGGTHKERRVALFEKLGGPDVGALARRRLFEGHADAAAVADWLRLAFPLDTRTPAIPTHPSACVPIPRCSAGSPGPAVKIIASTCSPIWRGSFAPRLSWAGKTIP